MLRVGNDRPFQGDSKIAHIVATENQPAARDYVDVVYGKLRGYFACGSTKKQNLYPRREWVQYERTYVGSHQGTGGRNRMIGFQTERTEHVIHGQGMEK